MLKKGYTVESEREREKRLSLFHSTRTQRGMGGYSMKQPSSSLRRDIRKPFSQDIYFTYGTHCHSICKDGHWFERGWIPWPLHLFIQAEPVLSRRKVQGIPC